MSFLNYHYSKHAIHTIILVCIPETYLDSSYAEDDTRLNLKEFTLIRADNPHNFRRGGVSIYFKEHLAVFPVRPLNLHESLVLEINIQKKKDIKSPCTDHLVTVRISLISFFLILNSLYLTESVKILTLY